MAKTDKPAITAPATPPPTKRLAIDKSQAQMVAVVAVAAFVTIFSLVAAKAVFSQNQYQARVTSAKEKAHQQLQKNISAFSSLSTNFQAFDAAPTNVIGGTSSGSGANSGSNSKIVLDALPPSYDFPALTASLEKILADRNLKVTTITGTDDQINQQNNTSSPTPQPVTMPVSFTVSNATYASVQQLVQAMQQSIRPLAIDTLNMSGGSSSMTVTVTAHTYYQPSKNLTITKKVIK